MYMKQMQASGYNGEERLKTIKKASEIYEKMKSEKRNYNYRKKKSKNWHLKNGKHETVMFVNATPNEILKRKVEQSPKKRKIKVKVVERRGNTMKKMLQKSDPFRKLKCIEDMQRGYGCKLQNEGYCV